MMVVTSLVAKEVGVRCPTCHNMVDGWSGDPRGEIADCEYCGCKFKVHSEADIEMEG